MYLNFSNFRGRTSAGGGGQALVQKRGQVSGGGGDWQNFRRMGGPPQSPRKKTLVSIEMYPGKHTTRDIKNAFWIDKEVESKIQYT